VTGRINPVIEEDALLLLGRSANIRAALDGTTLLLAGAGGFLGAYVLDILAAWVRRREVSVRVLAVDNFASGIPQRIAHLEGESWLRIVEHDLRKPLEPGEPVHWILHGASIASPTFYRRFPLETIDVNVQGTRHLLDLARSPSARGMLFLSSSEIYGDPSPEAIPTPEDYRGLVSCTGPRACYDESKRLGETLCTTYHRLHATPVKIGRPFNVYGPGQRLDDRRIIPDLVSSALAGGPLVLLSDGRATRSFCYARDAASAILTILCAGQNGEAYNLGNDAEEVTMLEVARAIQKVSPGASLTIEHRSSPDAAYLTDNPQRRRPDLRKLRAIDGWSPDVSLDEGLARTLRSYREAVTVRP
jgi:dTDP-glucose 4,6-dehydratase/UDP-glucuronate decarboxylase